MARAKRFRERRAEMALKRRQEKLDALNKEVMSKIAKTERYAQNKAAKCYGLHRRPEVRILEGKMTAMRPALIIFWTPERIRNDPFVKARVIRQNTRRKKSKG